MQSYSEVDQVKEKFEKQLKDQDTKLQQMHEKVMKLIDEKSELNMENYELKKRVDTLITSKATSTDFKANQDVLDLKKQIDREIENMKKDEVKSSEKILKLEIEKKKSMSSNG